MEDSDDNYDLNDEDFVTFGQTLQTPSPNQTQNNFIENQQNGPKVSPPSRHHDRKDGKDEKPLTFDWSGFEQMAELQQTNANLLQQLDEYKAIITKLEAQQTGNEADTPLLTSEESRVRTLARRVRDLTASRDAEKSKSSKLKKTVASMQETIQEKETEIAKLKRREDKLKMQSKPKPAHDTKTTVDINELNQSMKPESEKLVEIRQELQATRQQLKLAHSALVKELGGSIPISRVLSQNSQWRGRAEEISRLKVKLSELSATSKSPDGGIKPTVVRDDIVRRKELEQLTLERDELKSEIEKFRQKNEALKARNKVVTRELKQSKETIKSLQGDCVSNEKKVKILESQLVRAAKDQVAHREREVFQHRALQSADDLARVVQLQKIQIQELRGQLHGHYSDRKLFVGNQIRPAYVHERQQMTPSSSHSSRHSTPLTGISTVKAEEPLVLRPMKSHVDGL
eukprot:m.126829 g.126829  ORF g.126829 m.126829 type:complete len:458 (+) comp14529_c0_seq4:75-1448(+)